MTLPVEIVRPSEIEERELPPPINFGEIDFEQIEYRNEYRHTKSVFVSLFSSLWVLNYLPDLLTYVGVLAWLGCLGLAGYGWLILFLLVKLKSRMLITGSGITLRRPLLKDVEIPYSEIGEITFDLATGQKLDNFIPNNKIEMLKVGH